MNGVEIYSDDFIDQNLNIAIEGTNFLTNSQIGLLIARIAINQLDIDNCKACTNSSKGCVINIVHHRANQNVFSISNSKFSDNKETGLQIDDSGFSISKVQSNNNSKNGISLHGTFKPKEVSEEVEEFLKESPMNTTMTKVSSINNQLHGISVKSYWKGIVTISDCSVLRNKMDGIHIYNPIPKLLSKNTLDRSALKVKDTLKVKEASICTSERPSTTQRARLLNPQEAFSEFTSDRIGEIVVTKSKISKNKLAGISLMNTHVQIGKLSISGIFYLTSRQQWIRYFH